MPEITAAELRDRIPAFADLPEDGLEWMAERMTLVRYEKGQAFIRTNETLDHMTVVLEGSAQSEIDGEGRFFTMVAGEITGVLPYSRLTHARLTIRAIEPSRVGLLHREHFTEMLYRMPTLGQRLVSIMSDRIREVTKRDVQREKMMALGKLSAGMAHELNNPAAAARRAAASLRESFEVLRQANIRLDERSLTPLQRGLLTSVEREIAVRPQMAAVDSLERSDREEELASWLTKRRIQRAWDLAGHLADAGFDPGCLDDVADQFPCDVLEDALVRMTASVTVGRLVNEIENSACRISELVQAIKEYSYMDQMPEQEIDVHKGLESTLTMLRHQLKGGITVERNYDPELPPVCARGSELNQVWTNLIDNASYAMNGKGILRIRTAREFNRVLVEIGDNGPGIPKEIEGRIFEPFFTTKQMGEGTGLGLDMVYRIVTNHDGDVRVESVPGDTRFQVRLPAVV